MSKKTKRMPSEHRISGIEEGGIQVIDNDFGSFVLVRLAKVPGDYGYDFIHEEKTLEEFNQYIATHNDAMQDAINDKTQDYINDNQTTMEA